METSINVYPILATWKKSKKNGLVPIHIAVDINNKRAAIPSLKRKIDPAFGDAENRCVKKGYPNADLINAKIKQRIRDLDAEYLKKDLLGFKLTKKSVRNIAKGADAGRDFYAFCRHHIDAKEPALADSTQSVYLAEVSMMEKFSPTLTFAEMDKDWFSGYARYMREKLRNKCNTIWKSFKFLNTFLNDAVEAKIILSNPLDGFDWGVYQQGIPDYLEWNEVFRLKKLLQTNLSLTLTHRLVGYCFLLSCLTGLRFSDSIRFDHDKDIFTDSTGRRIILNTQKTGEIVSIAVTPDIGHVVDFLREQGPFAISNQKYNEALKFLGVCCGFKTPLHSHMGRHSFGMRCAEIGMPIEQCQRLMGHSSITYTQIYYRVKNKTLDDAMRKMGSIEEAI